ncbi:MAG: hypothetical protein FD180_1149, partial [Planctomycetota bacterium]
ALSIDPENPDALAVRIRLAPPPDKIDPALANAVRADAWRALDAFPPLDPRRAEAVKAVETALSFKLPLLVRFDSGAGPWVDEMRLFNALARLSKAQGDREAIVAVGDSGIRGAADFLPPAGFDPAAAVARLRCGDLSVLQNVIDELHRPAGTARMEAAEALAWRSETEAIDALRQHLGEGEPVRVRLSAALAAGASDAAALDVLEKYGLPSDEDAVFLRSASILLAAGRPKALDALSIPQNATRATVSNDFALNMLGNVNDPDSLKRLEDLVKSNGRLTIAAARILVNREGPAAMEAIGAAIEKCERGGENEIALLQLISPRDVPNRLSKLAERIQARIDDHFYFSWPEIYCLQAETFSASGEHGRARSALSDYANVFEGSARTQNNFAWLLITLPESREPELSNALSAVIRAIQAEPTSPEFWDTFGHCLRKLEMLDFAAIAQARAMHLAPLEERKNKSDYYEEEFTKVIREQARK